MWNEYVTNFLQEYDFPQEGTQSLLGVLEQVLTHDTLAPALLEAVAEYERTNPTEQEQMMAILEKLREAIGQTDFSAYAVELLFFILCMKHLRVRYEAAGLPVSYYDGVAVDLRAKLIECYNLKGIWGATTGNWFCRFFSMGRFPIGRLQFEYIPFPAAYCNEALLHLAGQPVVSVHIPSIGPLRPEDVRASMAEAAAFYAPRFPDRNVFFICHSWLLFPGHREMLPESSGICRFMDEFELAKSFPDPKQHDLWRIFYTEKYDDLDALPQNTSLQRAYVRWLKEGKAVGGGLGFRHIQG